MKRPDLLLSLFLLSLGATLLSGLQLLLAWNGATDPFRIGLEEARRAYLEGRVEEALARYRKLEAEAPPEWQAAIAYDLGTLHLQQAVKLWRTMGVWAYDDLLSHLHFARENLKRALRLRPDWLEARYQLELALRIEPPPREKPDQNQLSRKSSLSSPKPGVMVGGP